MPFGVVLGFVVGLVVVFLAVLNAETVSFNYYFGQVEVPLVFLLLAAALLSALSVGLFFFIRQIGVGFTLWDYRNKVHRLSREIEGLKRERASLSDDLSCLRQEWENASGEKKTPDKSGPDAISGGGDNNC